MYRNILLADDDRDNMEILKEAMDSIGSRQACRTASNCSQAIEILQNGQELPYLIFLDFNVPGVIGIELLQKIKGCDAINQIPVALYSSHTLEVMQNLAGHSKLKCRSIPYLRENLYSQLKGDTHTFIIKSLISNV